MECLFSYSESFGKISLGCRGDSRPSRIAAWSSRNAISFASARTMSRALRLINVLEFGPALRIVDHSPPPRIRPAVMRGEFVSFNLRAHLLNLRCLVVAVLTANVLSIDLCPRKDKARFHCDDVRWAGCGPAYRLIRVCLRQICFDPID